METPSDRPLRVLVRHANPLFSAGLAAVLGAQPDFDVKVLCGHAGTPSGAGPAFDVLVTDLETGLATLRERPCRTRVARITREPERPRLVIVASDCWPAEVRAAVESGARGFLAAQCTPQALQAAVRAVGDGLQYLCEEAAEALAGGRGHEALTDRQTQVLRLLAHGWSNKSIARELGVTADTVKSHIKHIMERLGAVSRVQAVSLGLQLGLVAQARPEPGTPSRSIVRQGRVVSQMPAVHHGAPSPGVRRGGGGGKPPPLSQLHADLAGARTFLFPS